MLMKYLQNYTEVILDGYGHGQMIYFHGDELSDMIVNAWGDHTSTNRQEL